MRAILLGIHKYDRERFYSCPKCHFLFSSFLVRHNKANDNGSKEYCPHCKTELGGLK